MKIRKKSPSRFLECGLEGGIFQATVVRVEANDALKSELHKFKHRIMRQNEEISGDGK